MLKRILGIIVIICALFIAFYPGLYICFLESIADTINSIINAASMGTNLVAKDIFWSLFKLFVGTTFFEIVAMFAGIGGICLLVDN